MKESDVLKFTEEEGPLVSGDRWSVMVQCPKCETKWSRRGHLNRHLTTKHKMLEIDSTALIEKLLAEVSWVYFLCLFHKQIDER